MQFSWKKLKLVVLGAGLLLLAVLAGALTAEQTAGPATSTTSSRNSGPRGLRAFHEVLSKTRDETPVRLDSLGKLGVSRGVLVIAGPLERPLTEDEARYIWSWVRNGNGLLYIAGTEKPDRATSALDERVILGGVGRAQPAASPRFTRKALSTAIVPAFQPAPMILQTMPLRQMPQPPLAGIKLYTTSYGSAVSWIPLGEGNVLVVAKSTPAQNRYIDRLYNLDFLLCAVNFLRPDGGSVFFDEYHHRPPGKPELIGLLTIKGVFAAMVEIAFCALLYFWLQGRRMGPPAEPEGPSRRGMGDYLRAAGSLYHRECSPGEILAAYVESVSREVARRRGVTGQPDLDRLASVLAQGSQSPDAEVRSLLERARTAEERDVDMDEATELIRRLSRIVHTVRSTHEPKHHHLNRQG